MTSARGWFRRRTVGGALAAGALVFAAFEVGSWAAGIPTENTLTYSGTLQRPDGAAVDEAALHVEVRFFDAPEAGAELCRGATDDVQLGRFSIPLPAACASAVQQFRDVYVEVAVNGTSLGRTKAGAVPYAIEAAHATSADTASGPLATRLDTLMPAKSVVTAYLSAEDVATHFDESGLGISPGAYAGWALCNGNNGTPDLANRFVRVNVSGAGAIGGSDSSAHTHSIDHDHAAFSSGAESGHTHSTPAHQHALPIGWDATTQFWVSNGDGLPLNGNQFVTQVNRFTFPDSASSVGNARVALTDSSGAGTSGPGSVHSHGVDPPPFGGNSGPASGSDNRPAYYELVALMRL
ncbi:MAG TPA: hypothetical protein VMG12_06525 [Polyangiaceae bacterium]|nr:hypothetical protein [Polyangiaceae bacterium]